MNNGGKSNVKEEICSFTNLYKATQICRKNVRWKDSVAHFSNRSLIHAYKLKQILNSNYYEISPYSVFVINEPKTRTITSTRFKDRVFQRSLCDNYLTKEITKGFIPTNFACQKGKGTDRARECLSKHLKEYYKINKVDGYVLKVDIHDYFGSTTHDIANKAVRKRVKEPWVCDEVQRIIDSFEKNGDKTKGIGLGSQVSQLIQLAVLDDLDHYIVEELGIKLYVRYMDDFILIHKDKYYLAKCLKKIIRFLKEIKLEISPKKTHIFKITQPIRFLGMSFKLWSTGKVTWKFFKENIKDERRKLRRLIKRVSNGLMTMHEFDECYQSWRAFAKKSDSRGRILKMDKYKNYLKENCNEVSKKRSC